MVADTASAEELLGHGPALQSVRRLAAGGKLAHALLITGPSGIGKTTFSIALAADLTCLSPSDGRACGECRSCELVRAQSHPDVLRIAPPKEETTITQMRELRYVAGLSPSFSPRRVVILQRAETLNEQAANAILKVLEDSPPHLVLMLLAPSPEAVLSTIRSRSIQIPLRAVAAADLTDFLEGRGVESALAASLASFSGGMPGRAISLAQSPELTAIVGEIGQWLSRLSSSDQGAALKLSEEFKGIAERSRPHLPGEDGSTERQAWAWALDALSAVFQSALHHAAGVGGGEPPDSLRESWNPERIAEMLEMTNEVRRLVLAYAQADLQFDRLVMRFLATR